MDNAKWSTVRLSDVATITMGQSPPSSAVNNVGNGLPFIQGNAEFGSRYPEPVKFCSEPKKSASSGDILLSVRAPVGALNIAEEELCIGRGLAAITATNVNAQFLWYALGQKIPKLVRVSQGSTFLAVNKTEIQRLIIPIPSLMEQRKISAILSSVDEVIEITKAVIEQLRIMKFGLIDKLFRPNLGVKSKVWERVKMGDIVSLAYGKSLPAKNRVNGTIPVCGSNGIVGHHSESLVQGPGIIIGRKGSAGSVNWIDRSFWPIDTTYYVIMKEPNDLRWLYYWISTLQLERLNQATGIPGLNRNTVANLTVHVPPIQEQREISTALSSLDDAIEGNEMALDQLGFVKRGLMSVLLTGELRVALDTGTP